MGRRQFITLLHVFMLVQYLSCVLIIRTSAFSAKNTPSIRTEAIQEFTSEIHKILTVNDPHEFISFTLKGPRVPRKTKQMSEAKKAQVEKKKQILRGKIKEVHGRLIRMKKKKKGKKNKSTLSSGAVGTETEDHTLFVQTIVKFHSATDIAQNYNLEDVQGQLLTFFADDLNADVDNDGTISEWGKVSNTIQSAECKTVHGTWNLDLKEKGNGKGKGKLCSFVKAKKTQISSLEAKERKPSTLSHDQRKATLVSPSAPFLQKLGITDAKGKPKIARSSKLRQCNKFVEIVANLVKKSEIVVDSQRDTAMSRTPNDSINKRLYKVVDMGCGRGYLTFALHSHLVQHYGEELDIQSRGVDVRPKLMKEVNSIARELGQDFEGLNFLTGTIENTAIQDNIDILIALHACDTATDDSIFYGIKKNANIIVVAPCCHKEVRSYLDAHIGKKMNNQHPYIDLLRHNIYKERISETITDSIRALLLEIADYDVSVFEFIGGEHTSKNVMITAVKRARARTKQQKEGLRKRLTSLADLHGIQRQKLAVYLGEALDVPDETPTRIEQNIRTQGLPSI